MYARYGFMELRIKEAVWRFESVYASIFDYLPPIPEVVNLEQSSADERGKGGDVPSSVLLWKSVEKDNHAPAAMLH
jgi:hypothetical protein